MRGQARQSALRAGTLPEAYRRNARGGYGSLRTIRPSLPAGGRTEGWSHLDEEAIRINPRPVRCYPKRTADLAPARLAQVLAARVPEGIEAFERSLHFSPGQPRVWNALMICTAQGRRADLVRAHGNLRSLDAAMAERAYLATIHTPDEGPPAMKLPSCFHTAVPAFRVHVPAPALFAPPRGLFPLPRRLRPTTPSRCSHPSRTVGGDGHPESRWRDREGQGQWRGGQPWRVAMMPCRPRCGPAEGTTWCR